MSRITQGLKHRRRHTGALPDDATTAADLSLPQNLEGAIVPPTLLDHFPSEGSAPPVGHRERADRRVPAADPLAETSHAPLGDRPGAMAVFRGFNRSLAGKVVSAPRMDPGSAEQYRRLAAALHHVQVDRAIKKVMVTSAVAGEGKTLTALNLALTLSESYRRRVVVFDADLRCPRIHELLDVPNVAGLSEALKDTRQTKLVTLLQVSPRLSVLPAGGPDPDPMSALTSRRMALILNEAAANFDWVIVDTPPVVLLPDTNLLAGMVDVAVVVIKAGQTAYDLVDRAVQAVGRQRVLGVVLNHVDDEDLPTQYYSAPINP
jgi:capsular exopolysaccharide synthesis family protein